jgi:hypothetical protein
MASPGATISTVDRSREDRDVVARVRRRRACARGAAARGVRARVEVHAPPASRVAAQYKLHGRVVETHDADEQRRFAAVTLERLGWEPYPRHHLFRVDVESAAWISFGEDAPDGWLRTRIWRLDRGYEERGPYPPPGTEPRET